MKQYKGGKNWLGGEKTEKPGRPILSPGKKLTGGKFRPLQWFTVYIENRYLRIDICIESNLSVSKTVSITNVNGQTMYISTEIPLASSEIAIILD